MATLYMNKGGKFLRKLWCCVGGVEWTKGHGNCLCQEILVPEPFKCKKGSISKGKIREKIANNLNGLKLPRF